MTPKLSGIDHVHVYVPSREDAADWFQRMLGFRIAESLRVWAVDGGPLTIENDDGSVHIALFERQSYTPSTAIAFGTDADNFLQWKTRLADAGVLMRCTDHKLAWSLYFSDPYENSYEITTYEHAHVRQAISG